jgi:outer membrane protein OmpA-like peptidoglycan-associated protein
MLHAIGRTRNLLLQALCIVMLGSLAHAATQIQKMDQGKKAKITGTILSRDGDLINIQLKKQTAVVSVNVTDDTKFIRNKALRLRGSGMDVTAMLPGLIITAEGVGNGKGQLDAGKITFSPDVFDIEVAQEKQIEANKAAASQAQSTANQGVAAAGTAQSSANQAQGSANQAQSTADAAGQIAVTAGAVAITNADSIALVNKRVSDLGEYKTVVEAALFFESGQSTLSSDDKAVLDKLAADAKSTENYMIEIAGYASSTGTKTLNQKLSDERATAVANYLRSSANVPMRRILAPAGYGANHAAAPNTDQSGRDINRRVDVKVLLNKGLDSGV